MTDRPKLPEGPLFCDGLVEAFKNHIWAEDSHIMIAQVRGWGYLTGRGQALDLDTNEATEAQHKAAKFIADAINEKLIRNGHVKERTRG